jgi:hypothetical protein
VIIIDPDGVTTLVILGDAVGKRLVDFDVVLPRVVFIRFALGTVGNLVVEDGPKHGLAVVGIMTVEILVINKHGKCFIVVLQFLRNAGLDMFFERVSRHAQSSYPQLVLEGALVGSRFDSIDQAPVPEVCLNDGPVSLGEFTVATDCQ